MNIAIPPPVDTAPPSNLEAEQSLLGVILMNNEAFYRVDSIVKAEDFSEEIHARIFETCAELIADGRYANVTTLNGLVAEWNVAGLKVGEYLARLAASATAIIIAPDYARIIRDCADRRRIIEIADGAKTLAQNPSFGKTARIAADMVSRLDPIASAGMAKNMRRVSLEDAAKRAYRLAEEIRAGKPVRGIPTGLSDLDDMIGALERGQGSILAGRPSMGKSGAALQIAFNAAWAGVGVIYISLEMDAVPLSQRILSSIIFDDGQGRPVDYSEISRGRLSKMDMDRLADASRSVEGLPFQIEQQPRLSMSQIAARVRQARTQFEASGHELGLIIVDHIGLVDPSSRYSGTPHKELGEISSSCHQLARETDAHCMMLSQLSRKCEDRENKRPQLSDLRESGELEQNADLVFGAFREAYYLSRLGAGMTQAQESELVACRNKLELSVLKNRGGETGTVHLFADMGSNAIRSAAR